MKQVSLTRAVDWRGVWTAVVTPFDGSGRLDINCFQKLIELQVAAGVRGVVVAGTTGEGPTLTREERMALVRKACEVARGEIAVVAGTGTSSTEESVLLSADARESGAKGVMVVTPPYNKPTPAGLQAHLEQVAARVGLPICLYHVPGRTAQSLSSDTLVHLSRQRSTGIVAIKEASGDLTLLSRVRRDVGDEVAVLSGDDPTFFPSVALGSDGVISVVSNLRPKSMVDLWRLCEARDYPGARSVHHHLFELMEAMFVETNPGPVKYALSLEGQCMSTLRLPLVPMTDSLRQDRIKRALKGEATTQMGVRNGFE